MSLHSLTTDSNSLYQNYKAINSFPKYSLCRKLTLGLYVCSQSTEAAFNESRGVIFFRVYAKVSKLWEAIAQRIMQNTEIVEWDKLTSVCDYFHSPLFFLTPFVELKYGKRKIPVKIHELTTREASDVITRFKSHARGRRI